MKSKRVPRRKKKPVLVRNHEYCKASTAGAEVEAYDIHCPCRNCYIISWRMEGKKEVFFCKNREEGNCNPKLHKAWHKVVNPSRDGYTTCSVCNQPIKVRWSNYYNRYMIEE